VPGLTQRFSIQEILFLEVDLGQMLCTLLDLDTTGGTGRISSAVMIERKP
jgi:hypothetical protein